MDADLLVKAREELISKVINYFVREPDIVGLFLGGSIAAGTADVYSDIDLRVVVTADAHARFVANRRELPKQWGELLFNEWIEGTTHCVSHFRPFGKIDVLYISLPDFKPSPWYSLPTKLLYDPEGILADVMQQSSNLSFNASDDEIDRSISKGLSSSHEAYRRVLRGELLKVYRQQIIDLHKLFTLSRPLENDLYAIDIILNKGDECDKPASYS